MKSNKRKFVLVVSSNRADYGLLEPLMKQLISEKEINFGLIVTGSHLLKKFGFTFNDINPKIQRKALAKIKVLESTSKTTMIKNTGYLLEKFSSIFKILKPDLVIILGDRYEIFSAATSCLLLQIPLPHIHGGEVTSPIAYIFLTFVSIFLFVTICPFSVLIPNFSIPKLLILPFTPIATKTCSETIS